MINRTTEVKESNAVCDEHVRKLSYSETERRQSKFATTCFTLCTRFRKKRSKKRHTSQGCDKATGSDAELRKPTAPTEMDETAYPTTIVVQHGKNSPGENRKRSGKQVKIIESHDMEAPKTKDLSKNINFNLPVRPVETVTSHLKKTVEKNVCTLDSPTESLTSMTSHNPSKGDDIDKSNVVMNSEDQRKLQSTVEHCEKRLERLYGRLIWLRNSGLTNSHPAQLILNPERKELGSISKIEGKDNHVDMLTLQKQLNQLAHRVHDLTCQIETFSFLSWIGLMREPQTNQLSVPGMRAPPPNPKLYLTRRPDSDARETIREYKRLCENPIAEQVRLDLRRVTFNNWHWSDAWLVRFVRQMFVDLGFVKDFALPLKRLDMWLCDIYRRYNRVPFHNYKHAFMVTQMCYALMWSANLTDNLAQEDQLALLISAICHDLDHPGFNNAYQINARTELAMRYNDQSPLENHHCATAFDILSHSEANPFEHLDFETMRRIRDSIIRCILATDMSRHNEIVNQFNTVVLSDLETAWQSDEESKRPCWATEKSKRDLVMMILIKVCDISNEARPLTVAGPWIDRLLAEFFHQSDYEKLVGLPVAPFMDREKVTKSASQCGFIRFVILPLFESLAKLLPPIKTLLVQPAIDQLNHYTEMQMLEEQQKNHNSPADLNASDSTHNDSDEQFA